jgi:hypothetical protein
LSTAQTDKIIEALLENRRETPEALQTLNERLQSLGEVSLEYEKLGKNVVRLTNVMGLMADRIVTLENKVRELEFPLE